MGDKDGGYEVKLARLLVQSLEWAIKLSTLDRCGSGKNEAETAIACRCDASCILLQPFYTNQCQMI